MADVFISNHLSADYIAVHWRLEWTRMVLQSRNVLDVQESYDDCWGSLVHAVKYGPHGLTHRNTNGTVTGAALPGQQEGCEQHSLSCASGNGSGSGGSSGEGSGRSTDSKRAVFLAADITPGEILSTSMSYTMDDKAKEIARQSMEKLFSSLSVVTWPTHEPWFNEIDSGVQGILDKVVAMKAGFFLGAPIECGGGHTYTEEIHWWRAEQQLPSDTWIIVKE